MKKIYLGLLCIISTFAHINGEIERRSAFDIGSGVSKVATADKVAMADADTETNQLVEMALDTSFPLSYQAPLDKMADGNFDLKTKSKGLKTFQEIKELVKPSWVQKSAAVAPFAFHKTKASSSKAFIFEVLKATAFCAQAISQRAEGEIAYFSALATSEFDSTEALA